MQGKFTAAAWLLCFAVFECTAADWTTIIEKDKYQIEVDIDSYRVEGGLPKMTIKTRYQSAQQHPLDDKKIPYISSVQDMQFNCQEPYYRIKSERLFDSSNQLAFANIKATNFKKIEMNTDTFSIGQLVCQVHQMLGDQ